MKENFVNGSIKLITKYNDYPKEKIEWINYGLQGLYSTITKFIVTFIISILLNIYKEFLIFMFFYSFLRIFASGLHANSNLQCWLMSVPTFIIIPYLSKNIIIPLNIKLIIMIFSIIMFAIFAPADTLKKPIMKKNIRLKNKLLTLFVSLIYLNIIMFFKNEIIINIIAFTSLLQAIIICPLTYYIFNQSFNNYLKYSNKF